MAAKTQVSEALLEGLIDRAVMRRLATDPAYRNAENAEQQAAREAEITREAERRLAELYEVV